MGWFSEAFDRLSGKDPEPAPQALPAPPTGADILAATQNLEQQIAGKVPPAVFARVRRISMTVEEMVPRLDRLGIGSQQAHIVVATATSYLPEAVAGYLRLPRDFADRRAISGGKTALIILCDQLDLLGSTLDKISDAVSRQDAEALVAHGQFLAEKFATSSIVLDPSAGAGTAPPPGALGSPGNDAADQPRPLEAP